MAARTHMLSFVLAGVIGVLLARPVQGAAQETEKAACEFLMIATPLGELRQCGEDGHVEAALLLGIIYSSASDVPRDYAEAIRWFRMAAEQNLASAQLILGSMYYEGEGVPADHAEALRWFRLAAEQGDASAQSSLGFMYGAGEGVPQDFVVAYMWYNLSAAQGDERAKTNRAIIAPKMTREQIAEAQKLSREWLERHL